MGVSRQHRLNSVPNDLGEVRVVDPSDPQVRDVAVSALVGTKIKARRFLRRFPDVAVEVALPPHAAARRRKQQLATVSIEVDLGFEQPG